VKRSLLLAALLPLGSCVFYLRSRAEEPVPPAALESLTPGRSTLGDCLDALGAPMHVFEYGVDGMGLLWAWQDVDDWSLDISVPVYEQFSASFDLDVTDLERPGCVLWFGSDLLLERRQSGLVGDILPDRVRPTVIG